MKVHYTCSTEKLLKYKSNYLEIRKNILELGHKITRDWLDEAIKFRNKGVVIDKEDIYKKVVQAILAADVLVVEGTVPSFDVGNQVTIGLNKNKPVLFLLNKEIEEQDDYQGIFIEGNDSPLISTVYYDSENLKSILEKFFRQYKDGLNIRFNLVLNNELDNYLDWAAYAYKTNKSEYIRRLVKTKMLEDGKYQETLNGTV